MVPRFEKVGQVTTEGWARATSEMRTNGKSWSTVCRQTTYLSVLLKWAKANGKLADDVPSKVE